MYAIRSKKTNRWFHGINAQAGAGSSLRIQMDDMLPALFRTKEMAEWSCCSIISQPSPMKFWK